PCGLCADGGNRFRPAAAKFRCQQREAGQARHAIASHLDSKLALVFFSVSNASGPSALHGSHLMTAGITAAEIIAAALSR
ncbi:MAG TPA: hypothetical protein VN663_13000, partial [Ramlibacter sp.]|nr:hypothetical protein [Ramlibacter sp.]